MRQTVFGSLLSLSFGEKCFFAFSSGNRNAFVLSGPNFDLVDKDVYDCADLFEIKEPEYQYLMAEARCMPAKTVDEHGLSYNVYAKDIEFEFPELFVEGKLHMSTHPQITESGDTYTCELEPRFEHVTEEKRSLPQNVTNFFLDSFNTETQEVVIVGHGLSIKPDWQNKQEACSNVVHIEKADDRISCTVRQEAPEEPVQVVIKAKELKDVYAVVSTIKSREVIVNEGRYFEQKEGYRYSGSPIQNEEWFERFTDGLMLSYSKKFNDQGDSEFQLFFDFADLTARPEVPCIEFFNFDKVIEVKPEGLSCQFEQNIFGFTVNFKGFDRNQQNKLGHNMKDIQVAHDLFIEWNKKQAEGKRNKAQETEKLEQKQEL